MNLNEVESDFLRYIITNRFKSGDRIPALGELSDTMGISVNKLREQMEVARSLGIVGVRPRTGIKLEEYDFLPAVRFSLLFALAMNPDYFQAFGELRKNVEASFWDEAVKLLTKEDKRHLQELMRAAWAKLNGAQIQIPHAEHRELHLTIFKRLENPFVKGILEAYWEAYEAVELNLFSDYRYLREVWTYHQRIVDCVVEEKYEEGYNLLIEHTNLLRHREVEPDALEVA